MGAGTTLLEDKQLKERDSASFATNGEDITIVKWNDNNFAYTASTFVSMQPTDVVKRWDKRVKDNVEVVRPKAIEAYNKHRGGVDLNDFLISCYRHNFKHKRWYPQIFFHFINVSIVNGWLVSRWLSIGGDEMDLLAFRSSLARMLINLGWNPGDIR